MRRRLFVYFRLCLGVCLIGALTTSLRAQSDYLSSSPHSPAKAQGWQKPAAPDSAPAPATTFDETRALGEARSVYADAAMAPSPDESSDGWMLSTVTALGVVVGLILLLRAGYTKMTGRTLAAPRNDVVQVLSRVSVAPRNHVLLLRVGGRILVVGDSPGGMNSLAQIDDPDEVASLLKTLAVNEPNSISQGFSQLINRFNTEYSDDDGRDSGEYVADRARGEVSSLLSRLRTRSREVVG